MTIARRIILDRVKTAIQAINGTGGYTSVVGSVHRHARTWNEARETDHIAVCIAPRVETYRYQPASTIRAELTIDLLAYIRTVEDDEDDRIEMINDLIDDLIRAMHVNQTWKNGSNADPQAIATSILETETDEADFDGQETVRVTIKVIYDRTTGFST